MGIDWENVLDCKDSDKLQDAYESSIDEQTAYHEYAQNTDENDQYLKYPVCEVLYEAYHQLRDFIVEKCKEKNMTTKQIHDFFYNNLDFSLDECDEEFPDNTYEHMGYIENDLYRASELFYNMLRYIMRNYEHKKCTKTNILHFFVNSEEYADFYEEASENYTYLINEMSSKNPDNGIGYFKFDD